MVYWTEPVFDRTDKDVEMAISKIAEWVAYQNAGVSVATYDLKGCLNVSDINRIEMNVAYLSEKLTEYGYPSSVSTRSWGHTGLPNVNDIERILANVRELVKSYYRHSTSPGVPNTINGYQELNAVEKNLYLIKMLLDCMIGSFKKSGTMKVGSRTILPTRR